MQLNHFLTEPLPDDERRCGVAPNADPVLLHVPIRSCVYMHSYPLAFARLVSCELEGLTTCQPENHIADITV